MPWISDFTGVGSFYWGLTTSTPTRLIRNDLGRTFSAKLSFSGNTSYTFKSDKTYIWKTHVRNFNSASQSFGPIRSLSINPPYKPNASFTYKGNFQVTFPFSVDRFTQSYTLPLNSDTDNTLVFIDRPNSTLTTQNQVIFSSDFIGFETSGIVSVKLLEIDWLIQGYSYATSSTSTNNRYEGWRFNEVDESFSFFKFTSNSQDLRYPLSLAINTLSGDMNSEAVATNNGTIGVTSSNFISKYISSPIFNLDVSVSIGSGFIDAYLFNQIPPITTSTTTFNNFLSTGQKLANFTQSGTFSFYNLSGEKYLTFVSSYKPPSAYVNNINSIKIVEGYSETDNNEEFLLTNTDDYFGNTVLNPIGASIYATYSAIATTNLTIHQVGSDFYGLTGATGSFPGFYTNLSATIANLNSQSSKIGNSRFKAGVWENGVWNSGIRIDENVHEFDNVELAIKLNTQNINWRIQIFGSTFSTSQFEIGDRVAISNIVAININDERKLLKNYFTIVNKSENRIVVETSNNFPIRRIEKDSDNHKILVTKNVWLNGGFLNGYFEGVWNDGLFRGYPYITEMYDSHWIDGTFNGGHFYSDKLWYIFTDTYYWEGFVGLTFGATAHGFLPGDKVIIDKFDKDVNPNYDGEHEITKIIDDYLAITDIPWETSTTSESGIVFKSANTGLVQNFTFYSNNVSTKTSQTSTNPSEIWKYNSWMDLVYVTQSSTNIGSNKVLFNASSNNINEVLQTHKFGFGDYTALNHYGYITNDVLSSVSQFRDLETNFKRNYTLGTKYKIYQDFLGSISEFENAFDSDPEFGNLDSFYADGWTYSFSGIRATFSYLNRYIKDTTVNQTYTSYHKLTSASSPLGLPSAVTDFSTPGWTAVSFTNINENDFGGEITEVIPNREWQIGTTGIYDLKIKLNTNFETEALAPGIAGFPDNDYIYLTGDVLVGQLRLVKISADTNSQVVLVNKTIKTTGGNYNVGTVQFEKGDVIVQYSKDLVLTIDWKGEIKENDKIRVEFQKTNTRIVSYNSGGPWRGSGFDTDLKIIGGVLINTPILGISTNDHFTEVKADWTIKAGSFITFLNAGVDTSLGFSMKRTSNKTFQYQSDNEISFFTLNNSNISIEKNRYSMIQFDIIQQPDSVINLLGGIPESFGTQSFDMQFHTIDLYNFTNFINQDLTYGPTHAFPSGYDPLVSPFSEELSIYANGIDYKYTGKTTVTEYFYNRPGLDLGLWNFNNAFTDENTVKIHELDNIKFYEVDMIPFFQYTTEEYVNKQIQVPLVGVAPIIDYSDEAFNFVGNIQISLDGVTVDSNLSQTSTPIFVLSGVTETFISTPVSTS